jgi:hypothetical protein
MSEEEKNNTEIHHNIVNVKPSSKKKKDYDTLFQALGILFSINPPMW